MTAPGNAALLLSLLAVFVACCAYAAGRLHQRYQMDRDREEAYRDGYDTATRSVFSLAARVIAPRRSARGSAPAPAPAADAGEAGPAALPAPGYSGLLRRSAVPGAVVGSHAEAAEGEGSLGFPAPPPPPPRVVGEPAAIGGLVYRPFPDPRAGDDTPKPGDHAPKPGDGAPAAHDVSASTARQAGHLPSGPLAAQPTSFPPGTLRPSEHLGNDGHEQVVRAASEDAGAASQAFGAEVSVGEAFVDEPAAEAGAAAASTGRHTVPDELVQASTYRLPPDRVFRAKVRDTTLPDEQTAKLTVPKPRKS